MRSVDLNPDVGVRLLPNVLLEIDGRKVLSGGDGTYSLLNLPDLSPQVLFAEEESGAIYYAVATPPLEPRSRSLDLLLFPRGIVELETSGGEPEVLTTLEYLEVMTKNNNPADRDRGFHPVTPGDRGGASGAGRGWAVAGRVVLDPEKKARRAPGADAGRRHRRAGLRRSPAGSAAPRCPSSAAGR